ncbi:MAG: hypothetical protein ABEJ72_05715, partial [Candidatus Aenigmatarchaeota archaeon]
MQDAIVASNKSTYRTFKAYGVDYLYLQKFSIKQGNKQVSYPLDFVRYVISSPNYRPVYSYPQNCLSNQRVRDCVL